MNYQLQAALDDGVASGKQLQRECHDQWRPKQPSGRVKVVTKVKEVMFDSFGSFQCHFVILSLGPNCSQRLSLHLNLLTRRVLSNPQTPYQALISNHMISNKENYKR